MSALTRAAFVALVCCRNSSPPGPVEIASFPVVSNPDVDILFLDDNSPGTADHQNALAMALPALFAVFDTLDAPPNVHIGVATSDLGTTGSLDPDNPAPTIGSGPGMCAGHGDDGVLFAGPGGLPFLIDVANADGSRMQNFTGAITDALAPMLKVGSTGCGFEQHLAAIQRALANPANGAFIRPTANLAIIVLADEDDCSVSDPALFTTDTTALGPLQSFRCTRFGIICDEDLETAGAKTNCRPLEDSPYIAGIDPFAAFFQSFKPDPHMLAFTEIIGDPTPVAIELRAPPGGQDPIPALAHSCMYTDASGALEVADPGVRLAALLDDLPDAATALSTVCTDDYTPAASAIGHAIKKLVGDPCVDLAPGCTVSEDDTDIPMCPADGDCYETASDPHACPDTPGNTRLNIQGSPPAGTRIHIHC